MTEGIVHQSKLLIVIFVNRDDVFELGISFSCIETCFMMILAYAGGFTIVSPSTI